ncbi:MAG: TetR/AcrR family transcriptional regulator [Solirubrobacteraceae bacterium]
MASTTRDRIVEEAMRLFGDQGYKATTIAQIEAAAGLTPGAGGLYHHFKTKEEVLTAGIERHLARLDSLRDIRRVLGGLGDLTAELTVTARFILAELDNEAELLRILASEGRNRPELLTTAVDQLIGSTFAGFAGWIAERSTGGMSEDEANATAGVGLGGLMSSRLLRDVLGAPLTIDDEALVSSWVQMMVAVLGTDPTAPAQGSGNA